MYALLNNFYLIHLISHSGACMVSNLSQSPNRFLFGVKVKGPGMDHIFTPSAALRFGNANELYMGHDNIRGILVDKFTSCQYSSELDATMNVTWYFSGEHYARLLEDVYLVQIEVKIIVGCNGRQQGCAALLKWFTLYEISFAR